MSCTEPGLLGTDTTMLVQSRAVAAGMASVCGRQMTEKRVRLYASSWIACDTMCRPNWAAARSLARPAQAGLVDASRALFAAAGLNPDTGAGTVTNATALAAWQALAGTDTARALERHRIARFEKKPPAYPVRWLNQALNKFGLDLEAGERNRIPVDMPLKEEVFRPHVDQSREQRYTIRREPSKDKAGVRMAHPGWNLMQQYHEARQALPRREFSRPAAVDIDIGAVIRNAHPLLGK